MNTIYQRLFLAFLLVLGLSACSKVEYDYKALGFSDQGEMLAAHAQGYHTKQKLVDMTKSSPSIAPPIAVATKPQAPVASEPDVPASGVNQQASIQTESSQKPETQTQEVSVSALTDAAANCNTVKACANVMLNAASVEAMPVIMNAARQVDAMLKPGRGDRKLARKLNNDGLEMLKLRKLPDAAALLTRAREADGADEEIIANLVYAYSEDSNYTKAEQLAYEGLLLNPRRSNIWLPIAIAKQKQGKEKEALQAMWIAWQFSGDKERMLNAMDKRIAEETDAGLKTMFVNAKAWTVSGQKPSF